MNRILHIFLAILFASAPSMSDADPDLWVKAGIEKIGPAQAPEFTLEDINGKKVGLKDLRGRVVVLNFWATWCPPCIEEMPSLESLHSAFRKKGLTVVAINDYEPKKKAVDFVRKKGYGFIILIDEKGETSEGYRSMVLPTTFIIDKNGMAIGRVTGAIDWTAPAVSKFFEELLKK